MYFNNVLKKETICEYRFKTEEELIKEFGKDWGTPLPSGFWFWGDSMLELLGTNFILDYDNDAIIDPEYNNIPFFCYKNFYNVTTEVLKKNDVRPNYNKPTKLVYESLDTNDKYMIVYKCDDNEETLKIKDFYKQKGYKNQYCDGGIGNIEYLFLRKNEEEDDVYLAYNVFTSLSIEEIESHLTELGYGVYFCNSLNDIKKIISPRDFKTMYKPIELVYEKISKSDKYGIFYKCESVEKNTELKEWINKELNVIDGIDVNDMGFIVITDTNCVSFNSQTILMMDIVENFKTKDGVDVYVCYSLLDIIRLFKFDSKREYNKPRELVYEKIDNDIVNYIIIYKCDDLEEEQRIKNYYESLGYINLDRPISDNINNDKYLIMRKVFDEGHVFYNLETSLQIEDVVNIYFESGFIVYECNSLQEIKTLIGDVMDAKIMYNEPRKLVYEKLEDYVKYVILYKCDDTLEEERLNNYYKSLGYNHNNNRWLGDGVNYTVLKKYGKDYELFNVKTPLSIEEIREIYEQDGNQFFYCDSLFELKKLINGVLDSKLMYNEPKKLVYEKKIFKFSEYKKGDN